MPESGWQPPQYDPERHRQRIGGDGGYPPQQPPPYAPQPGYGGYQPPPYQPRRRRSWPRRHPVLTGLLSAITLLIVIGIAAAASTPSAPPGAGQQGAPAARSATVKPHTVAAFSGNGQQNTAKFTVSSTWKLQYSFSCANFGQSGNFAVAEDGGSDLGGVTVNELATSRSGTSWAYDDAGTHYLEIDSECDWSVKVIDEG